MTRPSSTYTVTLVIIFVSAVWCPFATAQADFAETLNLQQVEFQMMHPTQEEASEIILHRLQGGEQQALFNSYLLTHFSYGGNFMIVNQMGYENVADLLQFGLSNLAILEQRGSANAARMEQRGNYNIFGAWLTGNKNVLDVVQEGNDNIYLLEFEGRQLNHTVHQFGDGNSAHQVGIGSKPFGIVQRGYGIDIRIEHISPGP